MPKIETPEEFAGKVIYDWREVRSKDENPPLLAVVIAEHVTARDAAIRAESAALLKMCGEALGAWFDDHTAGAFAEEKMKAALAALKETGVRV